MDYKVINITITDYLDMLCGHLRDCTVDRLQQEYFIDIPGKALLYSCPDTKIDHLQKVESRIIYDTFKEWYGL